MLVRLTPTIWMLTLILEIESLRNVGKQVRNDKDGQQASRSGGEEGMEQILPHSLQEEPILQTLHLGLPTYKQ